MDHGEGDLRRWDAIGLRKFSSLAVNCKRFCAETAVRTEMSFETGTRI